MIKIIDLKKQFKDKIIFENFNYEIKDESMTAIVGESGSGKTTLLNIIGLLGLDYEGKVLYDGVEISKLKEKNITKYIRDNINYLFQNYALIDDDSVEDNLLLS